MDTIEEVILLAYELHKDDKYGDLPYMRHLNDVYDLTVKYDLPEYVQHAAWLHDGIEMHSEGISSIFMGSPTMACWRLICKVSDEYAETRKERKELTFDNIAEDDMAIALKLCDLCANIGRCIEQSNKKLLKMYLKDTPTVESHLLPVIEKTKDWRLTGLWIQYSVLLHKAGVKLSETY